MAYVAASREREEPAGAVAPSLAELTWIVLLPCALVTFAAIVVLGPPLGRAFLGPGSEALWPPDASFIWGQPEPEKHARYLLALLGPVLLVGAVLFGMSRVRLQPRTTRALVLTSQLALLAFVIAAILGQNNVIFPVESAPWKLFSLPMLALALMLPAAFLALARRPGVMRRVTDWARDTPRRRLAGLLVAGLYAALWALAVIDTETTIAHTRTNGLTPWYLNDPFAILGGRTPLVDYHVLYAQLLPYLSAAAMAVLGTTLTVYTLVWAVLDVAVLLALYALLRRLTHSWLLALALYLPVVAASFFVARDDNGPVTSNVELFSIWPMRFGGPYVLAWLLVRHLHGVAPRRAWPLFLVAGLVAINDLEFGGAATAATLVALLYFAPPRAWRDVARLAGEAAIGLLAAVVLVALPTLARTGELPDFGLLLEFPHIFGVLGLVAMPMATAGFHLVLYATFVAAIAVATVRAAGREPDRPLTAMLAWSGVFGLLASSYFIGRSDMLKLIALFSIWALVLALLAIVVVRALAERGWSRPRLPELLVLAGLGLALCSLADTPRPWSQVERLGRTEAAARFAQPEIVAFVHERALGVEKVAILTPLGHRVAYDAGVENVAPYAFIEQMVTRRQLQTLVDAVHREGVHQIVAPASYLTPTLLAALAEAGFTPRAQAANLVELSD